MDEIYSVVALRISVFFSLSNNKLPRNWDCNKEELILIICNQFYSRYLGGVSFTIKCSTVEDLISKPQLQYGFKQSWKLCLNLCSRKWLIPTRNSVISLMPLWLSQLKTLFGEGLINFSIIFLKTKKLFEFRRRGLKLF